MRGSVTHSSCRRRARALRRGALTVFLCALPVLGHAQSLDNRGNDFILMFLENAKMTSNIELHITSDVATMATVEYPVNTPTFTSTVDVTPGNITVVALPTQAGNGWSKGIVENNAVRVSSTEELVVYMINRLAATSDAALGLPIDAMSTDYIAIGITGTSFSHGLDAGDFGVVAAFDGTTITITPTNELLGGFAANTSFDVNLNRGEAFYARTIASSGSTADLTGSIIQATLPVGVTNGNACANILPTVGACDHIFEVAQPVQSWGMRALAANLPNRPSGTVYRVVASLDATTISLDGTVVTSLDRGEFHEIGPIAGNHLFEGDKPIFVTQYMTGLDSLGATSGDPTMANLVPPEQYQIDYTFATVGGTQFGQHFLSVIANDLDLDTITLDGSPIGAAAFSAIGESGFSAAVLSIAEGTHTTSSPSRISPEGKEEGGHGITVEGYDSFDSYEYPGGALFEFINPVGDENPPLCTLLSSEVAPPSLSFEARDDRPSEDTTGPEGVPDGKLDPGEDLNGNGKIDEDTGIDRIFLAPGSSNLALTVDPFTRRDAIATFSVAAVDPAVSTSGSVTVQDGDGNKCTTGEIDLPARGRTTDPVSFGGWAEAMAIGNGVAHVAAQEAGLRSFTLLDPPGLAGEPVGVFSGGDHCPFGFFADDVKLIAGRKIVAIAGGSCGLVLADVSVPSGPAVFRGRVEFVSPTNLLGWAKAVAVDPSRSLVFVADFFEGLQVVDILNELAPVTIGSFGPADADDSSFGRAVAVSYDATEKIVYVATAPEGVAAGGLYAFDVTNPASPSMLASFETTTTNSDAIPQDILVDGDRIYLSVWKAGLRVLDVSMLSSGTISPDTASEIDIMMQTIAPSLGSAFFKLANVNVPSGAKRLLISQGLDGVRVFRHNTVGLAPDTQNDPFDAGAGFAGVLFGEQCCYAWNVHDGGNGRAYITFGDLATPHLGGFQSLDFSSDPLPVTGDGSGGKAASLSDRSGVASSRATGEPTRSPEASLPTGVKVRPVEFAEHLNVRLPVIESEPDLEPIRDPGLSNSAEPLMGRSGRSEPPATTGEVRARRPLPLLRARAAERETWDRESGGAPDGATYQAGPEWAGTGSEDGLDLRLAFAQPRTKPDTLSDLSGLIFEGKSIRPVAGRSETENLVIRETPQASDERTEEVPGRSRAVFIVLTALLAAFTLTTKRVVRR